MGTADERPLAVDAQGGDNPVDVGRVPARFSRMSDPISLHDLASHVERRSELIVAEARQIVVDALEAGHKLRFSRVRHQWQPLPEAEIERRSRVDRTLPENAELDPDRIERAEAAARAYWSGFQVIVSDIDTWAPAEQPETRELSAAAHEVLRQMGAQTLAEQAEDVRVCGGALRRHSFPPAEAQWLREGVVNSSTCGDCGRTMTRDELLTLAAREAERGTCPVCGEVLDFAGRSDGMVQRRCPTPGHYDGP